MSEHASTLPNGTLCLKCGYDLGGLAVQGEDARCPECGWRFGETYARRAVLVPAYLKRCRDRLAWWIGVWVAIVLAFAILGTRTMWPGIVLVLTTLLVGALVVFALAANGFWRGERGSRAFFRAYWLDNLWMLLLPLVLLECVSASVLLAGGWGESSWLLVGCWAALVVGMPNVFLWRLHVLQMRMGISCTLPASAWGVGALLTVFVGMLGFLLLAFD